MIGLKIWYFVNLIFVYNVLLCTDGNHAFCAGTLYSDKNKSNHLLECDSNRKGIISL